MQLQALSRQLANDGPQTDEQLHAWVKKYIGVDIPRVAVCPNHSAPFQFFADVYFHRTKSVLVMANRGGGKTFLVAILHYMNSLFKPGCEGLTFGATESQAKRCYSHLKLWIYDEEGNKRPFLKNSLQSETNWTNGSKVEIVAGTPSAVNGPHPQVAHADEVELMDPETWKESRNLALAKPAAGKRAEIPAVEILTSTRKGPAGRMQMLLDEHDEEVAMGVDPTYDVRIWCIFEDARQVKNCRCVRTDIPEAWRCNCDKVVKGKLEDGSPRSLEKVCGGRLYRSRGYLPLDDVKGKFKQNDPDTWEAQQECLKPSTEDLYVPGWEDSIHCIRNYAPKPELGEIFMAVDWGGTNPHSVHWYQVLKYDTRVMGWNGFPRVIRAGTIVCFDEIYKAEIGNDDLADRVEEKEEGYRQRYGPDWYVTLRYPDPQNKGARIDWGNRVPPLKLVFKATREFEEHIKHVRNVFTDERFVVDGVRCPKWVWEVKRWQRDPDTKKQIDKDNHAMSDFRYFLANWSLRAKKAMKKTNQSSTAKSKKPRRGRLEVTYSGQTTEAFPVAYRGADRQGERWRRTFGAPVSAGR